MATKQAAQPAQLTITRVKSGIGAKQNHRQTLRSLGLKKIGHTVVRPDDAVTRGMIRTVAHLVEVKETT
jgi:large subunit ribosomal protein L30